MASVKIHRAVRGIPTADVAVAAERTPTGALQIAVFIKAVDSFGVADMAASLRLSPAEAADLGAKLITASRS